MKYLVTVKATIFEYWEVEADSKEQAMETYDSDGSFLESGEAIHGEAIDAIPENEEHLTGGMSIVTLPQGKAA